MEDLEIKLINIIEKMRDEIIEFHQKLVQIPSENPPANYKEVTKFLAKKMEEIGLEVSKKRCNVIGILGKNEGKKLIFYGHHDTVEAFKGWTKDPFGGEIIDGKIYGRGSSDDKSCVTAEIFAAKALKELGIELNGKLTITAVCDEETGGYRGADYLVSNGIIEGDACLLGDGPFGVPVGYFGGGMFMTFLIKGKQSHGAGFPDVPEPYRNEYSGINAIVRMIKIMNFLLDLKKELNEKLTKYPLPPGYPSKISDVNLAQISGGTKISTVPDKCFLHVNISTIPEQDIESVKQRILDFIEKMKEEDPDVEVTVQIPIAYEPQIIDENSEFAKTVKSVFNTVFNAPKDFSLFIPTTDAHWFQEKGIETIIIGGSRMENNIHAPDEFVFIEDLMDLTKIFALTALKYLQ